MEQSRSYDAKCFLITRYVTTVSFLTRRHTRKLWRIAQDFDALISNHSEARHTEEPERFAVFHEASRPRAKEVATFGLEIFIEAGSTLTPDFPSSALEAGAHG